MCLSVWTHVHSSVFEWLWLHVFVFSDVCAWRYKVQTRAALHLVFISLTLQSFHLFRLCFNNPEAVSPLIFFLYFDSHRHRFVGLHIQKQAQTKLLHINTLSSQLMLISHTLHTCTSSCMCLYIYLCIFWVEFCGPCHRTLVSVHRSCFVYLFVILELIIAVVKTVLLFSLSVINKRRKERLFR